MHGDEMYEATEGYRRPPAPDLTTDAKAKGSAEDAEAINLMIRGLHQLTELRRQLHDPKSNLAKVVEACDMEDNALHYLKVHLQDAHRSITFCISQILLNRPVKLTAREGDAHVERA